jgi:hypothetical protein
MRVNTVGAVLSAGSLAYDFLASYGVRQGASGAEVDPGSAPGTRNVSTVSGISAASDVAACAAYKISLGNPGYTQVNEGGYLVSKPKTYKDTVSTYNGPYGNRLYCKIEIFDYLGVLSYPNFRQEIITNSSVADSCTESATGAIMTMRADGKCPTGRYESATESQVSSRMLPAAQANPSNAAKAVLSAGQSVDSSPYSVTGPASQIGSANTTTTTGPTGTTATTKTPTYSYNYAGNTVTYNTTNSTVTNITNNTGGTSTTTTIEQVPASDNKQLCDAYPDSLACLKPGTVPDAEAVPIQRKQFSIVPDTSRWAPNAGACTRGAIQLSTGVTINIWKPFCDFFALIRGVVIGMFGLVGALIFKNGIK